MKRLKVNLDDTKYFLIRGTKNKSYVPIFSSNTPKKQSSMLSKVGGKVSSS